MATEKGFERFFVVGLSLPTPARFREKRGTLAFPADKTDLEVKRAVALLMRTFAENDIPALELRRGPGDGSFYTAIQPLARSNND